MGNRTTSQLSTTCQYAAFYKLTNTQQASYVYDANGNMVTKTDQSGVTQFVWDYENRLGQVIKPNGEAVNYKYDAKYKTIYENSIESQSFQFRS